MSLHSRSRRSSLIFLKTVASVTCSILFVLCAVRSNAQQQGQTFELALCNLSGHPGVFVALTHKQSDQTWVVDGWYRIPDAGCTFIGTFLRDTIYLYAESIDGAVWKAADSDQTSLAECVDHDKWFHATDGTACGTDQNTERFIIVKVPSNMTRVTLPLS